MLMVSQQSFAEGHIFKLHASYEEFEMAQSADRRADLVTGHPVRTQKKSFGFDHNFVMNVGWFVRFLYFPAYVGYMQELVILEREGSFMGSEKL